MNKSQIAFLKRHFPSLFYKVVGSQSLARIATKFDHLNYIKCMLFKQPYFGTIMLAGQTWSARKPFMRDLIKQEILKKRPENGFKVLEMGSWAGNSAVLWANAIREKNVKNGTVICVDPWESYITDKNSAGINKATLVMDDAARKGKIFKLFLHNIKTSGYDDIIKPIKGFTCDILPTLESQSFDLIYIDASHLYSGIVHDLRWALKLVRPGGVICGDDLEIQKKDIDIDHAKENQERDMVICPRTGKEYHPGITLAVDEVFGDQISCQEGFWHARK